MQYSHRNGETEPPTVKGWYWFRGTVDGEPYADSVTIMKVIWGDELRAIGQERVSPYLYYWQGEWYGPIVAPWNDNPAPSEAMVGVDWLAEFPPEWDRHPWANYAYLQPSWNLFDGTTFMWYYFECKPEWGERSYNWANGKHGYENPVTRAPLSTFFDVKDTLQRRPAGEGV